MLTKKHCLFKIILGHSWRCEDEAIKWFSFIHQVIWDDEDPTWKLSFATVVPHLTGKVIEVSHCSEFWIWQVLLAKILESCIDQFSPLQIKTFEVQMTSKLRRIGFLASGHLHHHNCFDFCWTDFLPQFPLHNHLFHLVLTHLQTDLRSLSLTSEWICKKNTVQSGAICSFLTTVIFLNNEWN